MMRETAMKVEAPGEGAEPVSTWAVHFFFFAAWLTHWTIGVLLAMPVLLWVLTAIGIKQRYPGYA